MTACLFIIRASTFANSPLPIDGVPDFNRRVTYALSALQSGSVFPAGFVALTAEQVAPSGWFICDGSAIERAAFPDLFGRIGETYGAGDGVTTFNLPTQAQCVAPAVAPTPPQVVSGGAVDPVTPPTTTGTNPVGSTGGNQYVGGRTRPLGYVEP